MEITGTCDAQQLMGGKGAVVVTTGAFYSYEGQQWGTSDHTNSGYAIGFKASRSWTGRTSSEGDVECRPVNYTCRIWKRTA